MWIDRKTYDDLRLDAAEARAKLAGMETAVASLTATMDWMRVRQTQLEHERAVLIQNFMGVTIKVPSIELAQPPRMPGDHPLNGSISFEDVGDEEAMRLGITHNADGTLRHQ